MPLILSLHQVISQKTDQNMCLYLAEENTFKYHDILMVEFVLFVCV